jgi:hypothetical protein
MNGMPPAALGPTDGFAAWPKPLFVRSALVLGLALGLSAATVRQASPQAPQDARRAETVAPGVEHIEIRRGDFSVGLGPDRWTIHVLVLDPARTRLSLGRARDKGVGTETTSSMAGRRAALAATNGGYFRTEGAYRGEPAGIVLSSGKVLSEPSRKRPGLAVSSKGPKTWLAVVDVAFRAEVVASKSARRRVDGVNRPRLDNELILFTPEFDRTTLTGPEGVEAVVDKGRVAAVREGKGDSPIPRGGWVVSGHGAAAAWLKANVRVGGRLETRTDVRLSPKPGFIPDFVLGGGPRLIRQGRPAAAADPGIYGPGFSEARHPRTAVGLRADGRVLLVAVDGRQPERSVGMTIAELTALDLTGERPVGDALLVFVR